MRAAKTPALSPKLKAGAPAKPARVPAVAPDQTEQELGGGMDDIVPGAADTLPVVGLGGSAGSIAALQTFFAHASADSGMAFVVVLHLAPEHESHLAAILQHATAMPVVPVSAPTPIAANHVYVIPPGQHLTLRQGTLHLSALERPPGKHVAVDLFFRSLADSQGVNAVAVVLSGAGGDGSSGVKRIKERGGLTVAQDPREAEQDAMPRAAIATKMVDWVLPVAEMPGRLREYRARHPRIQIPGEAAPDAATPAGTAEHETALRGVLALLQARVGSDFSHYKRATVVRRIAQRMQVNGLETMTAYLPFLRAHPGEVNALLRDLLISVTNFFRDRGAFAALAAELPRLFAGKGAHDTVRVWVAGCATGEEAYSVAMLLQEHAATLATPPRLRIFATDLDEDAIDTARAGVYPETVAADVSPERLQACFTKDPRGYRVRHELRDIVLFARHDLLCDPPFSRLGLVTCRNLFIYLNHETQTRTFDTFHYALGPGGLLLLGSSESADEAPRLFAPLDKKFRLYASQPTPRTIALPVTGTPAFLAFRRAATGRIPGPPTGGTGMEAAPSAVPPTPDAGGREAGSASAHLAATFERLSAPHHRSRAEHDVSTAALRSANEELQNHNEQLNAVTEELETGREELQSINEELTTVNQELHRKVAELAQTNADLQNLMASTNIATVFLDRDLRVQRYTPSAVHLFNLIPADAGRPLSDLSHRLDYPDLPADARRVLTQLSGSEREIHGPGETWLLARLQPYRATEERVAGVVLTFVDITERKRVEDDLRASEERFRTTTDSVPQIVWRGNTQGHIEFFNHRWVTYTGVAELPATLAELAAKFVHPDDAPALVKAFRLARHRAGPLRLEHRLRAAGGEYHWFLLQAEPQLDARTGRVVRWFGTCTDISERKGTEAALEATAERLRLAMDTAKQGTWDWNMVSGAVFWSPEHNRMYDLPPDQQRGSYEQWIAHVHPEDREATANELRAAIDERRDFACEMRSRHRDGSVHWISGNGRAFYDEAGQPVRMLGIVRDITARKEAEASLRESEQRFRLANFHSPFPVMLHADDGEVLQVNDAWTHQTGYSLQEVATVGDWIERAYATEAARHHAREFLSRLSQHLGAIESPGRRVRCASGEERLWDLSFATVGRLPDGRCLRITTATDVTERHRGEAALRAAKEEAERANRAKSEFLSRMSHELRTPLNAILGFGQILGLSALPEQDIQCVDHILNGGRHLLAMIDEVLDLARIEAGELALAPVAVLLEAMAHECVGFVAKLAEVREVTCTVEPPSTTHSRVLADKQRLRQVLLNLLSNAIKYNAEGGTVTLSVEPVAGDRLRLNVRDTGPGISPPGLARLFVPFERLGQELGAVEGTGLGLVVSKQLVEAMGGTLGVASEVGEGSTFWVELPLAVEVTPGREAGAGGGGALVGIAEDPSPASLLYVEDNASNLQVMRIVVERLRTHWRFLSAADGPGGLEQARRHRPDVILLDLQLPGLRGDAVLAELRRDPSTRDIPVLMLSADATAHSRENLLALGANEYLSKPFNIDELLTKIDGMLRRAGPRASATPPQPSTPA